MANITISTPDTFTNGVTIVAPQASSTVSAYLNSLAKGIAISLPTTATGTNLTSMGRYTANDSVWRIRNGVGNSPLSETLMAYGGGFLEQYEDLPGGTDTFVLSSVSGTHLLGNIVKAAGPQLFNDSFPLNPSDDYTIIGGIGNDSLTGSNGSDSLTGSSGNDILAGEGNNDTLIGEDGDDILRGGGGNDSITGGMNNDSLIGDMGSDKLDGGDGMDTLEGGGGVDSLTGGSGDDSITGGIGIDTLDGGGGMDTLEGDGGNDILTGGGDSDRFVFTNQGVDTVSDFSASANDVFAITSTSYAGAPFPSSTITVGLASGAGANTYIIVDTLANIQGVTSGNTRFAYDTTNNRLLYDNNGNWSTGNSVIANVTLTGSLSSSNFDFI